MGLRFSFPIELRIDRDGRKNSLVKELNPDILLSHTQTVIDLLLELGFLIS
jgi:hypothetical protein